MLYKLILTGLTLGLITTSHAATPAVYGPTAPQESLWSIATQIRPNERVSNQQVMLALRTKNPQAFTSTNVNSLKTGASLQVPNLVEIQRTNATDALNTIKLQNRYWQVKPQPKPTLKPPRATIKHVKTLQRHLQQEVRTLKKQLEQEKAHTQRLGKQLAAFKNSEKTTHVPVNNHTLSQLQAEITTLKQTLDEKNTHIENLKAALHTASESIKRQYSENQQLHTTLNQLQPSAASTATPKSDTKPKAGLTLTGTEDPAPQTPAFTSDGKPAVFKDQIAPIKPLTDIKPPQNATHLQNGVPLNNLIHQQAAAAQAEGRLDTTQSPPKPSRIAIVIAIASLLFIVMLLWRAFLQKRSIYKEINQIQNL